MGSSYQNGSAIVLGGGISGLTAARTLQEGRQNFVLLERCPTLGGLTRTVEVGEFCFDYTGHFLHLDRYATPEDIPYAGLKNEDWAQISRRSCCFVGDRFITAPIQYHIAELPPQLFTECVASYEQRPALPDHADASFRDYIVSGFGQTLADAFLIPQNEKTMAISLDRLSKDAVRRFFPAPNEALVRAGMAPQNHVSTSSYNSRFWYPRTGGIGRLVEGLRAGLNGCVVNQDAVAIDLSRKTVTTRTGELYYWEQMFSSIPLNDVCAMSTDPELRSAGATLSHSSTISFNIGLRGPLQPELADIHWLYVPGRSIPFYRVGFYSNIGPGTCTPGMSSLYVEVGVTSGDLDRLDLVHDLQPAVVRALENLGWIDSRDIVCVVTHVMRHAYVHHTPARNDTVRLILDRLKEHDVYAIGRYGLWDYTSMEDSMESARAAVCEATRCNIA
jgi:protoporphyrinogen oxidase